MALAVLWSATAAAQDGNAIFRGWIGKTVVLDSRIGQMEVRYEPDGSASVTGAVKDTGKWRHDDGGFCATWRQARQGREACFTIMTVADKTVILPKGGNEILYQARLK